MVTSILSLALKSLRNRKVSIFLTVLSIAVSVSLLLGVERIRHEARTNFANTISGTDLIVGARTSPVQLLLSSVFGLGDATNNIRWESYQAIAGHPGVAWSIPISLGDSHAGYRVLGTTGAFFKHFRYGRDQALKMHTGDWFTAADGAVLGADVADKLGYRLGSAVVVAHGSGAVSFIRHDEHPFQVTGILSRTGTPVDRTLFAGLAGIDAIHAGMGPAHSQKHDPLAAPANKRHHEDHARDAHYAEHERELDQAAHANTHDHAGYEPATLTAFFIGLKSRSAALSVQRMVNEYADESLTAIMPAVALQQLWEIVGVVEKVLLAVSALVVVACLAGMLVAILSTLNERRREMAILRAVGARPMHVLALIVGEAALLTLMGVLLGIAIFYGMLTVAQPLILSWSGLLVSAAALSSQELLLIAIVCLAGVLIGLFPGYRIYRYSLADGMTVRT